MKKGYAIVTGAGSGIGKALSYHMASRGYDVVLADSESTEKAEANAEEIRRLFGVEAKAYQVDVCAWDALCAFRDEVFNDFGEDSLKVLINNEGTRLHKPFLEFAPEEIDEGLDASFFGTLYCIKAFLPSMYGNEGGDIISISANEALRGHGYTNAIFSASKGAIIGMNRSLRLEAGAHNVKCNVVAPGYIETEVASDWDDLLREDAIRRSPLGETPSVEEFLGAVDLILNSPTMTGHTLAVNSGSHVW